MYLEVIETVQKIFQNKRNKDSKEYLKGFADCFDLFFIGLKRGVSWNYQVENRRLERELKDVTFRYENLGRKFRDVCDERDNLRAKSPKYRKQNHNNR